MLFQPFRIAPSLACLLVLHLSFVDLPCAGGNSPDGADATDPHAGHALLGPLAGEAGTSASPRAASEDGVESCRAHSGQRCCEALGSCEIQLALSDVVEPLSSWSSPTLRGADLAPGSGAPSPDTPPPKA